MTIIIALTDSLGHFSTLKAVADELLHRKHRVIFFSVNELDTGGYESVTASQIPAVLSKPWAETTRIEKDKSEQADASAEDKWTEIVAIVAPVFRMGRKELAKESIALGHGQCQTELLSHHDNLGKLVDHIKPDVVVSDLMLCYPCIMNSPDTKWARLFLGGSLAIYGRHYPSLLPPEWYGLPTLSDSKTIQEHRDYDRSIKIEHFNNLNTVLRDNFNKPLPAPDKTVEFVPESPYLNIYMYPGALDYDGVIKDVVKPKNWIHVDSLIPKDLNIRKSDTFSTDQWDELDKFISQRSAEKKLIYFSMGTLASADTELMKRILDFLKEDTKNLYIVSMGPRHEKLQLGDNMYGRKFIDQLYVLPKIDLIITHGGNNTITESFHYGVPGLIVLPVFDDQHDNARRVQEIKVGRMLDTYNCTKDQLFEAIESVLADSSIKERMKKFSMDGQKANGLETACSMIEDLAKK